jgi:hypothetical protein
MTVCGGWTAIKSSGPITRAITLFCRSWSCPDCMPVRLAKLKAQAAGGEPTTFLTLTVNARRGQSVDQRARELVDAMKVMFKRAARKWSKSKIEYLAVFEETKRGEPHLHLLMRAPYIPQRWISDVMAELIEAPVVDIRAVRSARLAARYVAKYVAKGPKSFGTLKRYWMTPKYDLSASPRPAPDEWWGTGWRVVQSPLFLVVEELTSQGVGMIWVSATEACNVAGPS